MTTICHASDWHGHSSQLPEADLYVFTGDMLANYPSDNVKGSDGEIRFWTANLHLIGKEQGPEPLGERIERVLDPVFEQMCQSEYIRRRGEGYGREWLASRDAPVLVVRGNHDFTDLSPMFGGNVLELTGDASEVFHFGTEHGVLRIGGCRGINYIRGEWMDELHDGDWDDRVAKLPEDLDVLVTHAPANGVLDKYGHDHVGSSALRRYLNRRWMAEKNTLKAHLFGHIHECLGTANVDGTVLSNAATGWHLLELS